jgi:hypothetical protein
MGAIFYVCVDEILAIFAPSFHVAAIGAMLLIVILFMPAGLVPFRMQRFGQPIASRLRSRDRTGRRRRDRNGHTRRNSRRSVKAYLGAEDDEP